METIYNRCKELLEKYFKKGDEVGLVKLRGRIIRNMGGDERTITKNLKIMLETGLIKDINYGHFRIL